MMFRPFASTAFYTDQPDIELVNAAREGNREALEDLVRRHQIFIYNVASKMVFNPEDAEDLTQEVLVKVITNLATYRGESSFRTWLYRIVTNHFLNMKKRKAEVMIADFGEYFGGLDRLDDEPLTEEEQRQREAEIDEVKISCTAGMLLCLNREQRIAYVLGEIFDVNHTLGAEILNITRDNFRQRLSRARKELYQWMNHKCGLINKSNPCRCAKKTNAFVKQGWVDKNNLLFNVRYRQRIVEIAVAETTFAFEQTDHLYKEIYQGHPLQAVKDPDFFVKRILDNETVRSIFRI
jgi:RNA polymerase sigma factor (sigma-70 family)